MSAVDRLADAARDRDVAWTRDRADRVRAGALAARVARERRASVFRRVAIASGAALAVLAILVRTGQVSPEASAAVTSVPSEGMPGALADPTDPAAWGDAGFRRD